MKLPFSKKIFYSVSAVVLFFAVVEAAFLFLKPVFFRTDTLEGSADPKKRIELPENIVSKTADSILINIRQSGVAIPDHELLFRVAPNLDGKPMSGHYGINQYGFRDTPFEKLDYQDNHIRILVVGDSCGFGWRISRLEDTFPHRLEEELDHKLSSRGIDIDRINLSQPGYSTTQSLVLMRKWIDAVKPHFVVTYFGWNDVWKSPLFTDRQMMELMKKIKKDDHQKLNVFRKLLASSNVYRAIEYGLVNSLVSGPGHSDRESDGRRVSLQEMEENYSELQELTRKYNSQLVIVPPPFRDPTREHPFLDGILAYNERVKQLVGNNAVYVNLPNMQHDQFGASSYFVADRFHPNELGAEYIAKQLSQVIEPIIKNKLLN